MKKKNEFTAMAREADKQQEETMEWKAGCDIIELPTRLRRLAEYRKENTTHTAEDRNTVNAFVWSETEEGGHFWRDIYIGDAPSNLFEVLDKFDKEHPELCKENEVAAINWEQRRYEIAKACMAALVPVGSIEGLVKASVTYADALISELKKEK